MKNSSKIVTIKQSNNQTIKQSLKTLLFVFVLISFKMGSYAQIYVDSSGKVGLHTSTTSTGADVFVYGSFQIGNDYGTNINFSSDYGNTVVTPGSNNQGYIGTSTKQFSTVRAQYHYATTTLLTSDKRLKENFRSIDNPLDKILNMNGHKYDFILTESDSTGTEKEKDQKAEMKKDKLGFIAQELIDVLPEAVDYEEEEDRYYIDYNAVIPVIVEAMKEQQAKIEALEAEIEALNGGTVKEKSVTIEPGKEASLLQNIPNPFGANTTIGMYLPATVTKAVMYIYNMQGEQILQLPITERGNTSATIEGNSLKAGIYLYTLIADGKEVDTKKMILTK